MYASLRVRWVHARRAFLLIFVCLLLTGCTGRAAVMEPFGRIVSAASVDQADRNSVLLCLRAAADDFKVIDALLADPDLDLLEQGIGNDDEVTDQWIDTYLTLLYSHKRAIEQNRQLIAARSVPPHPDLVKLQTAQLALFDLSYELLEEYEEIISYSSVLLNLGDNLESLSYYDESDLEGTYQTINEALIRSVSLLGQARVPSFLQNMNDNLIDALEQMNDAVLYTLIAVSIEDPLRLDAADYRMDILLRRFDLIIGNVDQDMGDRQAKLMDEIMQINRTNNGLKSWVSQNIDRLQDG